MLMKLETCLRWRGSLDDINNLDEWIARSSAILLFASDKYFTSLSCQNEILSTLKWKRPFFLVHEVCHTAIDCHSSGVLVALD